MITHAIAVPNVDPDEAFALYLSDEFSRIDSMVNGNACEVLSQTDDYVIDGCVCFMRAYRMRAAFNVPTVLRRWLTAKSMDGQALVNRTTRTWTLRLGPIADRVVMLSTLRVLPGAEAGGSVFDFVVEHEYVRKECAVVRAAVAALTRRRLRINTRYIPHAISTWLACGRDLPRTLRAFDPKSLGPEPAEPDESGQSDV